MFEGIIRLIAKKLKIAAYTLIVVLFIASFAVGCAYTDSKDDDVATETIPTEKQPSTPHETTQQTETTVSVETTNPVETAAPTEPDRTWPYGEISDSDAAYPPVVTVAANMGPLYQEPMKEKICISLFTTLTGERQVYIIPENQDVLLAAFKNAYSGGRIDKMFPGVSGSMSIHFKGNQWHINNDGTVFLSSFGGNNILPPEATSELVALCKDAVRKAGISDPVTPADIRQITSATLNWDGKYTITDTETLERLESLLRNSHDIGYMAGCPFDSLVTLNLANGKTLTIAVANDSCDTWMSNGACYSFYPQDGSSNDGNKPFYNLFAVQALHYAAGGHMENMRFWWEYLDWDPYGARYGDQEARYLMNQFQAWIQESYHDRLICALLMLPDLNGDYSEAYGAMLTQLYEYDPKTFANQCLNNLSNPYQENVFHLLGQHWDANLDKVRSILQKAILDS